MHLAIFGPHGLFSIFTSRIVADVLKAAGRKTEIEQVSSLATLGSFALRANGSTMIAHVRKFDRTLSTEIASSDMPILIAQTHPAGLFGMLRAAGIDADYALREVSAEFAGLVEIAALKRSVTVCPPKDSTDLRAFIERIAHWAGQDLKHDQIQEIAAMHAGHPRDATWLTSATELGPILEAIEPAQRTSATSMFEGLEAALHAQKPVEFSIGPILFVNGNPPHDAATLPIDMTGYPRLMFFGPYIHLPAGAWAVRLLVSFSESARDLPCRASVEAVKDGEVQTLSSIDFTVALEGQVEIRLYFRNPDPTVALEFRLSCQKSVFDGFVELHDAILSPREDEPTGDLKMLTD